MGSVINIAAFIDDNGLRRALIDAANLRDECLRRCYEIPGYVNLTYKERAPIYDKIMKKIEMETGFSWPKE